MLFKEQLVNYELNAHKAQGVGCSCHEGVFYYTTLLAKGAFEAQVSFTDAEIDVKVVDSGTKEPYTLLEIPSSDGPFVMSVRHEVEQLVQYILDQCFDFKNIKQGLVQYMMDTYGTIPESPWKKYPKFLTFKTTKKQKWYAIMMNIPATSLGSKGAEEVEVLNVKINPPSVAQYIEQKTFFPAYHMNKKHWITIMLHKDISLNMAKTMIDESYKLVES